MSLSIDEINLDMMVYCRPGIRDGKEKGRFKAGKFELKDFEYDKEVIVLPVKQMKLVITCQMILRLQEAIKENWKASIIGKKIQFVAGMKKNSRKAGNLSYIQVHDLVIGLLQLSLFMFLRQ